MQNPFVDNKVDEKKLFKAKKLADDEKSEKEKIKGKMRTIDARVGFQSYKKVNYRGSNYGGDGGHVVGGSYGGSYGGGYSGGNGGGYSGGNGGYGVGYGGGYGVGNGGGYRGGRDYSKRAQSPRYDKHSECVQKFKVEDFNILSGEKIREPATSARSLDILPESASLNEAVELDTKVLKTAKVNKFKEFLYKEKVFESAEEKLGRLEGEFKLDDGGDVVEMFEEEVGIDYKVYNTLREHCTFWKETGASSFAVSVIENGYCPKFKEEPVEYEEANNGSYKAHRVWANAQCGKSWVVAPFYMVMFRVMNNFIKILLSSVK